jgi:hypothetical protein
MEGGIQDERRSEEGIRQWKKYFCLACQLLSGQSNLVSLTTARPNSGLYLNFYPNEEESDTGEAFHRN